MLARGTAAALLLAACSSRSPATPADAGPDTTSLDDFFGLTVHEIEIEVDEPGVESLLSAPREYVHARVSIDRSRYEDVGVRLKGGAGSFVPLDGDYPEISGDGNGKPGKSAFIIDFNRFVRGTHHLGLEKLTLNNLVQDPSCIHEYVGYALFRAGGVPASRAGFAQVTFNDHLKGLYALIESQDNDEFLLKWYGTDQGNLYEGAYGADLRDPPEGWDEEWFDQDNGDDTSMQDLRDLIRALDAADDGDLMEVLQTHFDLAEYLTFAATELYLGHWDGYAWSVNNYAIHHDPVSGLWTFLPWGIDQLFEAELHPFAGVMKGPGPSWDWGGRIHQLCFASADCRARLRQSFGELLDRVEAIDLIDRAASARAAVQDLCLDESIEYGEPELTTGSLDRVAEFIETRREAIEAWLPCLTGGVTDNDDDGYDGCSVDCDDRNEGVHPGAAEPCDLVDNDCNSVIDDPPMCPKCFEETGPGGIEYGLCFERVPWPEARQRCLDHGQDLASIHDPEQWEFVTFGLIFLGVEAEQVWIGLEDMETEGLFTWTDGSDLDYRHWTEDAPKPPGGEGDHADCVVTSPWGWVDLPCDREFPFVCREPM